MTTYVMMHGGGMGAWVWRYVTPLLRKAGHDVFTTTFTGFGERSHLIGRNVTNATHVTDIVNVLSYEDIRDCVLVGHSYAGTVAPGVVQQAPDRVKRVALLDSLILYGGECVAVQMGGMPAEQAAGMAAMLADGEGPIGTGVADQQRAQAKADPHQMPPEREKWLLDHLSDMPFSCIVNPVVAGAETIKLPVDYYAATHTVIAPLHPRARELGWTVHTIEGDHAFLVGQPELTAEHLLRLA